MIAERDNNLFVKSLEERPSQSSNTVRPSPHPVFSRSISIRPSGFVQSTILHDLTMKRLQHENMKQMKKHETVMDISSKGKTNELVHLLHLKPFRGKQPKRYVGPKVKYVYLQTEFVCFPLKEGMIFTLFTDGQLHNLQTDETFLEGNNMHDVPVIGDFE